MIWPKFPHKGKNVSVSVKAKLDRRVYIGNNVTIYPRVSIGKEAIIMDGAILGRLPIANKTISGKIVQDFRPSSIGKATIVGCNSVLYTGIQIGRNVLIGDLTSLRENCTIGDYSIVGRGVQMLSGCRLGDRVRVQDQVHLAGGTVVENDVFIAMGVVTTNDNEVYLSRFGLVKPKLTPPILHRFSAVGANATLLPGVVIGEGAMVGAGAVVTEDVAPWAVVVGSPARKLKKIKKNIRDQFCQVNLK